MGALNAHTTYNTHMLLLLYGHATMKLIHTLLKPKCELRTCHSPAMISAEMAQITNATIQPFMVWLDHSTTGAKMLFQFEIGRAHV